MWENVSSYQARGITASSLRSKGSKIDRRFDVGVFFSTFESRGLVSSQLLSSSACDKSVVVLFEESKDHELRKRNDSALLEQVRECSREEPTEVRDVSTRNTEEVTRRILASIPKVSFSPESNWFVDIVGAPKPCFLEMLGYMRYQFRSPKLTFFYSTGDYEGDYEKGSTSGEVYSFTVGLDRYMWVPHLWGRPDPTLSWTYIFLLGFEGNRSYEIYDRFEPRFVEALIGKPGFKPQYPRIVRENNAHFLQEAKPRITYSDAGDSVEVFKRMLTRIEAQKARQNICFVPLSTKPHALGAALASLTDGSSSVLYLMPRAYKVRDIPRCEHIWLYEIVL